MARAHWRRNLYFVFCLILVVLVSGIRSAPLYGKLDFILLDDAPWWNPWRPMIERVLAAGKQPILTDVITSTVLRAVFAQRAMAFRRDRRYDHIKIQQFLQMNQARGGRWLVPGSLVLLLHDSPLIASPDGSTVPVESCPSIRRLMTRTAAVIAGQRKNYRPDYPYRCLINLHPFSPSWVPVETRHWSIAWADPTWIYQWKEKHGKELRTLLKKEPPENCMVFF